MALKISGIDGATVSARRRFIWDSAVVDNTTTGDVSFFSDPGGKNKLQMDPLIDGRLPNNQRMIVQSLQVHFPAAYDLGDDLKGLDQATVEFIVNDNRVEKSKLEGHPRNFPAGGGIHGVFDSGDLTGNINQQNMVNGWPAPRSMFFFDDMPVTIEEQVTFEVKINIPTALTGLTSGRWYVVLLGEFEFLTVKAVALPPTAAARAVEAVAARGVPDRVMQAQLEKLRAR